MSTVPQIVTLTNSSVDILNVIRNNASQNYKNYVPVATEDAKSLRAIGSVIMDYPSLQNEFLSSLINRIGRVLLSSKMYDNPIAIFKKGLLEYGETVEEIFVNIAKPFQYDPEQASKTVFAREIPDVKSAFHIMNYQKYYKVTIEQNQLRQSFISYSGITDLITKIVNTLYTSANYDEFLTMKYLLAKRIINGQMYPVTIPTVETENMNTIVANIKSISNKMEFLNTTYNLVGVSTNATKDEQYVIVNSDFDAKMDVEVLASAFNMSKADFMGHRVLLDGFGDLDTARLDELFENDPTYETLDSATLSALNEIPAVIIDKNWFMVFDNLINFTEHYNGEGLYWNYWYHTWKTFSVSPFSSNAVFIPATPTVTSVSISPSTANVTAGQRVQLTPTVVTENFAPKCVNWEISSGDDVVINNSGLVVIGSTATGEIVVTATSTYDSTKIGRATLTIS